MTVDKTYVVATNEQITFHSSYVIMTTEKRNRWRVIRYNADDRSYVTTTIKNTCVDKSYGIWTIEKATVDKSYVIRMIENVDNPTVYGQLKTL